jgi:multiple sugar transport system substrate-binding protein
MRKVFALVLVLMLLNVGALFAQEENVELRIAWWGSQNRHDRTLAVIDMFMAEHPNITITSEFAGWDDYWVRMATEAAGQELPDIMQQDYARINEWVSRDLLLPLDEFVEDGTINTDDIVEASLAGGIVDGTLYAINLGNNAQTIALDVAAFEEAGLDLPSTQWTWTEFEEVANQLHDELGIWGIGANPGLSNYELWKDLYMSCCDQWSFSPDGTELGYTDDQPLINYFNMLLRLQESGAMITREEEVAEFTGAGVEENPIVTGRAAMGFMWSNQTVAVWTAAGEDREFRFWLMPRVEGGYSANYIKPSMFWSITAQSEHPQEAAMFIDFFTNSVEANEALAAERGVPISSAVREAMMPSLGPAQAEMFDFLSRVEEDSMPIRPPDPPGSADVINNVYWPLFVDPVLYGQIPVEEGVATLRTEANAILAATE